MKYVGDMSMAAAGLPAAIENPDESPKNDLNVAELVVLMCASALFTGLSPQECKEIASCARVLTFARNELLFAQGQPVRNLVLIQTGSVK